MYYTVDGADPRRPGAMVETGKTVLSGNAEKWAMVPSVDNGGNDLGKTWHGGKEPFDHDDWDSGNDGVGYDQNGDYDARIGIDVDTEMNDINQSVFVRIPFNVSASDKKKSNFMMLWMKYDDGFVAYLNGTRIANANATLSPAWNAGASGGRAFLGSTGRSTSPGGPRRTSSGTSRRSAPSGSSARCKKRWRKSKPG